MLDYLAKRRTPGVEAVEENSYRRTISVNGRFGYFEVSPDMDRHLLVVRIEFGEPQSLFSILERIRTMFDVNADWPSVVETLMADEALAPLAEKEPGLRVAACWNGFELTTRAILGQQITVNGATALAGRLVKQFGEPFNGPHGLTNIFPGPEILATANLRSIGLTTARAATVRAFARMVCQGKLNFMGVIDSEAFLTRLREIPGIGDWTAQYVAMRALGEPDALPASDAGLLRALNLSRPQELERRSEGWRPWRAYAAMYLWRFCAQGGVRREKQSVSCAGSGRPGK